MFLEPEDIEKLKKLSPEIQKQILNGFAKILAVRPHRFSEDINHGSNKETSR